MVAEKVIRFSDRQKLDVKDTEDLDIEDHELDFLEQTLITHCEDFLAADFDRRKIIYALTFAAQYMALSSKKQNIVQNCWHALRRGSEDVLLARVEFDDAPRP